MTFVVRYGGHGGLGLRERRKKRDLAKKIFAGEIQKPAPIRRMYRPCLRREGTWARIAWLK
jgi:hypothetical protein